MPVLVCDCKSIASKPTETLQWTLEKLKGVTEKMMSQQSDLILDYCVARQSGQRFAEQERRQMEHRELYFHHLNMIWDIEKELAKREKEQKQTDWRKAMLERFEKRLKVSHEVFSKNIEQLMVRRGGNELDFPAEAKESNDQLKVPETESSRSNLSTSSDDQYEDAVEHF